MLDGRETNDQDLLRKDKLFDEVLGIWLPKIEAFLEEKKQILSDKMTNLEEKNLYFGDEMTILEDKNWILGDKMTMVDFFWGNLYSQWFSNPLIFQKDKWDELLEQHPRFKAYG